MNILNLDLFLLLLVMVAGFEIRNNKLNMTYRTEQIETMCKENSPIKLDVRILKFNRTVNIYELNITLTDTIDHRYYFQFEYQLWGDGGWKRNAINYENYDPCKQLKLLFGPRFTDLLADIGLGRQCPFMPGFYHFKNYIDTSDNSWAIYYGKSRIIIKMFKHKKELVIIDISTTTGNEVATAS